MVRRMFYQKDSNLAQPRNQGTQVSFSALPRTSYVALGKLCNLESLLTPSHPCPAAVRWLQDTSWPWEPRLCRHLHGLVDPTVLPGKAESGSSRGQEQG